MFIGLFVCLAATLYYAPFSHCRGSSDDLFDGEQNLCRVRSYENTVHVEVNPLLRNKFTSYMFENEPDVLDQVHSVEYGDRNLLVDSYHYTYFAFALPNGSHVSFNLSASAYGEWYWSEEYSSYSSLKYNYIWHESTVFASYSFYVDKSTTYYLTCSNSHYYTITTDWNITVDYKQYDLSNAESNCTGRMHCKFNNAGGKYIVSSLNGGTLRNGQYTKNAIHYGRDFSGGATIAPLVFICLFMVVSVIVVVVSLVKCRKLASASSDALSENATTAVEKEQLLPSTTTTTTTDDSETPTAGPSSSDVTDTPPVYVTPTEK